MMYLGGLGMIFMAIFWVFVLSIVLFDTKDSGERQDCHRNKGDSVLDIIQKRYARGEINKKEFESIKKDLIGH